MSTETGVLDLRPRRPADHAGARASSAPDTGEVAAAGDLAAADGLRDGDPDALSRPVPVGPRWRGN